MSLGNRFWNSSYEVGIDIVDDAHKTLFRKIIIMDDKLRSEDYKKYECIETIKFLRKYVVQHFAEEEKCMLEAKYDGYKLHKEIHDNMRQEVLPGLEQKLRDNDFSREAISEFAAVLLGWLAGHIMIEDKAITGKAVSRFANKADSGKDFATVIDREFTAFFFELLGMKLELRNRLYDGAAFPDAFLYEMCFNDQYTVSFIIQYDVIKYMVSAIIGVPVKEVTPNVIVTFVQAAGSVAKALLSVAFAEEELKLSSQRALVKTDFDKHFEQGIPLCSMLWSSPKGLLAICIDKGAD